ncbi:MAG: hypothetical protein Q7S29_02345, partial [Candidatus Peribacter sp.]|nr:hypothetical protein [Candidatus Peribacter sp.]
MDHTHFNYGWSPEESRLLHEWGHAENFRREMRDMQERNDREFAAFREQSEKFNARVERVRSQRDEILARLQKMAAFLPEYQHADGPGTHQETAGERLKKDTRGRVLNAIQRLEQDYQREGAIVDSAGDRKYALIGNLERMLANYERQTEGFTREMRTTAMDHWNKTEAAYSRYDKTGNAIRRDRGVRNAQAEVTAATAAVQKAEEKEVDDGVATLATETATAKTKAETARTKANTAETAAKKVEKDLTDAKALKEKETENANKLKDLTKEHDDLIGTGIPAATKEHGDAINDAILAGVDKPEERGLIDKLTRETAATIKLIEEVKPPYDAAPWDPAKRTAEITRLKTVLE